MRQALCLALALTLVAPQVWGEAPATSLRPMPRPGGAPAEAIPQPSTEPATLGLAVSLRPLKRPVEVAAGVELAAIATPVPIPEPEPEPEVQPETGKKKEKASKKGSVCGDREIKGEALAAIRGKIKGCGMDNPVRVTSISGIRLNQPATISCDTAAAFKTWIEEGMRPAMGKREVVEIRIAASYVCRSRNNKKGAKISEHGRGRAVDIAGFVFSDGSQWSVEQDYNKQMRRAHKAACGIFGTTLGPGSDGYHEDHLHFDIARHSNGTYCR